MIKNSRTTWSLGWPALIGALVLGGCAGGGGEQPTGAPIQPMGGQAQPASTTTAAPASGATAYQFKTRTGVPIGIGGDASLIASDMSRKSFGSRNDPFALLGPEQNFDRAQTAERIIQDMGGYSTMYEPPTDEGPVEEAPEPQPYRRLAGILVGDTVSAIIIMENGEAHIIKPGMMIPNSPWRVVSIDEEKAVLRRAGPRKPTQIVVRLETPPGGVPAPAGGGGASGRPGAGQGGGPGGRPGTGSAGGPGGGNAPGSGIG